ncbi:hypothetical protein ACTVNB_08890, partial [Serratia nematodiphila]
YQYRMRNPYNGQVTGWETIKPEQVDFILKETIAASVEFRIIAAPPAPSNAQPVAWEMRYWNSGHNCWHDWERITAEQHAEMSVQHATDNDYEFRVLYDAPPAAAVFPERLPCPVHLLPGLKFGKGVPTRSMLDALVRRAEYEAELEAMTPEQNAEDDARIEAFKALLPQPPAQVVPDGFKLVPTVPTPEMIAAAMNCDDVIFHADESFCVNFGNIYAAMLAAAPEGGK